MSQIVVIHSSRDGVGKSNISAHVASLLALDGKRVGIVCTTMQSPRIYSLFGLDEDRARYVVNDYLAGRCDISQTAYAVNASRQTDLAGAVFVIPSSRNAGELARVLDEEQGMALLSGGLRRLVQDFRLDTLIIDTPPDLARETMLFMALADVLAIVLRPDQQEYQDTSVVVEVARKLEVPHLCLIVNNVPASVDPDQVKRSIEHTYNCAVAAVLPESGELMIPAGAGIFAQHYPEHPVTVALHRLVGTLRELRCELSESLPVPLVGCPAHARPSKDLDCLSLLSGP
jgi:MinD-like ATPase involved in chromosome partitioning or flagellar assembly